MNKNDFRSYFSGNFVDITDFTNKVLSPIFGTFNGNKAPTGIDYVQKYGDGGANISHIYDYGSFDVNGKVSVWEVILADNCQISRARKNIQTTIRRITEDYTGAFIVFHYANGSINPDAQTWRLSWLMRTDAQVRTSPAKRYTYLCGPSYSCRTIAERFEKLQNEPRKTLGTITKAFDVEALSDEFFYNYRALYSKILGDGEKGKSKYTRYKKMADIPEQELGFCDFLERHKGDARYFGPEFSRWDEKTRRDYVKKLMGRLVFLQFLQKKGWMCGNPNYIKSLFEKHVTANGESCTDIKPGSFLDNVLEPLFFGVLNTKIEDRKALFTKEKWNMNLLKEWEDIPYLNGGLFEQEEFDKPKSAFPNNIFNELLTLFSEYNFTIDENDPDDAEVGIDPEMLGKIFESQLEDNKDKGAFYTPKEIVQYMCAESLIAYLQTQVPNHDDEIRQFVLESEIENVPDKTKILKALKDVRICDPAIGSGAFPMGLLNLLVALREKLGDSVSRYEQKKEIIQNNIFGVDIEKGAVDIARLRFWLSIVIDEDNDTPHALPNLDYQIVKGNSLLHRFSLNASFKDVFSEYNKQHGTKYTLADYKEWVADYLNATDHAKKEEFRKKIEEVKSCFRSELTKKELSKEIKLKEKINNIETANLFGLDKQQKQKIVELKKQLKDLEKKHQDIVNNIVYKDAFEWRFEFPQLLDDNANFVGFDIVIGNPPYVSTKDREADVKKALIDVYGFADDLYSHFIILGFNMLKNGGIHTLITSDSYFTTYTKSNIRSVLLDNNFIKFIHWGDDVFPSAMVSTATFVSQKAKPTNEHSFEVYDVKGVKKITDATLYKIQQNRFGTSINRAFYIPNKLCCMIDEKYGQKHTELLDVWWNMIESSDKIERHNRAIQSYRNKLRAGDITLLGLVSEGGQGMATSNNGKFIGVREDSKLADFIRDKRAQKLKEFNVKFGTSYAMPSNENDVWSLFDRLKEEKGRDVFGQGSLFRIVPKGKIADVTKMSNDEKKSGIRGERSFVPYDKGDKDGNRWYMPTPYLIDWSCDNVNFLNTNSGKKGKGMPVVRNSRFYFKNGFCWNNNLNENYSNIKCRIKDKSVYDVASMSLFDVMTSIPSYFLVSLINSSLCGYIYRNFLNNTVNVQINDIRMLPVVVPTKEQLENCKELFDQAVSIQKKFFDNIIGEDERDKVLQVVQNKIDDLVCEIYGIENYVLPSEKNMDLF